jgi:hypothetical protein
MRARAKQRITIADAIRLSTSQNRLHPFVRDNWASPRGLCNCSKVIDAGLESGVVFCQRDYGHDDEHVNAAHKWEAAWPSPELYIRAVLQVIQTGRTDTLQPEFICGSCGSQVYFQREPGPCPQCGEPRPATEGTSDVS